MKNIFNLLRWMFANWLCGNADQNVNSYCNSLGNRKFKKLRHQLQWKRHTKIELKVNDYSVLITWYKIGEVHFRLLGTNGFHVKAKSERDYCCELTLSSEPQFSRCCLADYVKTLHQKACHTCRTIIFLHSPNQIIIDLWHCCWCCRSQILNSLIC